MVSNRPKVKRESALAVVRQRDWEKRITDVQNDEFARLDDRRTLWRRPGRRLTIATVPLTTCPLVPPLASMP
jgi:hypothetical protein